MSAGKQNFADAARSNLATTEQQNIGDRKTIEAPKGYPTEVVIFNINIITYLPFLLQFFKSTRYIIWKI